MNVGPDGKGRVPAQAAKYLRKAGEWVKRYPQVIYGAGPSPWGHAMPWGDVTTVGNTLNLVVFDWPSDGRLMLPGLQTEIAAAGVVVGGKIQTITWTKRGTWTELRVPPAPADQPASLVAVKLQAKTGVDQTLGIHPNVPATLLVEFAEIQGAEKKRLNWMEKFGEWKFVTQAGKWSETGKAVWTVDVCEAGDHRLELTYKGEGRLAWRIETDEGVKLQNQQNSSPVYHAYPFGLLTFNKSGKHTITVSLVDGDRDKASLEAVRLSPAE
ncbi:MAG: hypothetical protein ABSH20_23080 [Tepidisphaeraceae bacterium]